MQEKIQHQLQFSCFFPSSLVFLIVVEWFLIVIACFSKAKTKQTFSTLSHRTRNPSAGKVADQLV
jgi:hypothetical protein